MSKRIELPKYLRKTAVAPTRGRAPKLSEYGRQLREKQKARFTYGLREKQFRNYFNHASRGGGATGATLLQMLERRLDNVIYRLSLAQSRAQSRQMVSHGHVQVNGKKVNIPSYLVTEKDQITLTVTPQPREVEIPSWLKFEKKTNTGTVDHLPVRDEIDLEVDEQLIVEFYSR